MTTAYDDQDLTHTEPVHYDKQYITTTVGRAILNDALPEGMPYVNGLLKKKGIGQLVNYCYLNLGLEVTVKMLDRIKDLGFQYATRSGLSVGLDDMVIPESKYTVVREAEKTGHRRPAAVSRRRHHQRRAQQQGHSDLVCGHREALPTRCSTT